MELLYVWVEKYGNIRKQGFNFTNDYDVKVNPVKEKEFDVSVNGKDRINIFKNGDNGIIDIFGIIGKNGSGKTTILNAILSHKISGFSIYILEKSEGEKQYLVIYSDDLKIVVDKDKIELIDYNQEKQNTDFLVNKNYSSILEKEREKKIPCIYYDNIFNANKTYKEITRTLFDTSKPNLEKNDGSSSWNEINISTSYEFFHRNNADKLNFVSNEIKNSISFFQNSIFDNFFSIRKPYKFFIKNIGKNKESFNENFVKRIMDIFLSQYITDYKKILEELLEFYIEYRKNNEIQDSQMIEMMKTLSFQEKNGIFELKDNLYDAKIIDDLFKLFLECQKNEKNESDILEYIQEKFSKIKNNIPDNKRIFGFNTSGTGVITLKSCIKIMREFWSLPDKIKNEKNKEKVQIDFEDSELMNHITSFLDFTKENSIKEHFFEYDYDEKYSTGELAVITFFSRFIAKYQELKTKDNNNIMVLLDEPDIFMHPEWQRIYISVLKEFFEKFYINKKIKIILTSHSPFVASDLPRENVIMLDTDKEGNCIVKNDKDIKTFGANIFDLYTEAFFVESSFGEFAKGKIKKVVKDLTLNEKGEYGDLTKERIKEIEYIIDSIGEKLVSTKLEKLYEEYRNNKSSVEYKKEQLKMLQEKLGLSNEQMISIIKNGDLND